jgi:hypothetical protein
VEGQAEDLDLEVNGVAGQIALGTAPEAVLDDEAGIVSPSGSKLASDERAETQIAFVAQQTRAMSVRAAE